jgi:hypothetical protein
MNSWYHAVSASHKWGGVPEDYLPIENFIDSSKKTLGDYRHRAMYHHTLGVYLCEELFGTTITIQKNKKTIQVPVRLIAERHIVEDLGFLPNPEHYLKHIPYDDDTSRWMSGSIRKEAGSFNDIFNQGQQA